MPDTKHKRPEFKPPFPAAPTPPASDDVLTNEAEEIDEPVVVETLPEDDVAETEKPEVGSPKFVSKSASTLTREPVTSFLKSDAKPAFKPQTSALKPETVNPPIEREVKEIHSTPTPKFTPAPIEKPTTRNSELTAHDVKAPPRESSTSLFTTGIIIFSLIFGLAGWTLYFNTKFNFLSAPSMSPASNGVTVDTTTPTPETSPTPVDTRSSITIEVLNGSGVAGMAASTAEKLNTLGYTVISTGNADRSNYATTQILTSTTFATAELLISDLTKEFDTASISGELKDSTASARIIVGKDWTN
jgi:hypothetical protein